MRRKKILFMSKKLNKKGLYHDPNIGYVSLVAATIRELGCSDKIIIKRHELSQEMISGNNKFVKIANHLNLENGLSIPRSGFEEQFWEINKTTEKIGSIFIHMCAELYSVECYF